MDYNKIGCFIMAERKAKNLTQAKLAEKIFVSEKTVSKWENGNGVPDTNTLPKLCEIFGVSLNELLNGCRIVDEEYKDNAEKELLLLQKQNEDMKKFALRLEIAFGVISAISLFVMLIFASYLQEKFAMTVVPVVMIILSLVIFFVAMLFCLKIEQKVGYYICKKCGHKHIPSYTEVSMAMHICRTRYIKCPKCNKKSWHKKIIK